MDHQYLDLLKDILQNGVQKGDRTGTGTLSVFGRMYRHDLANGFPLITTKKLHFKSIGHELLWFITGDTNVRYLQENGVSIWNEWANEKGDLGPVYGAQWRSWQDSNGNKIDQLQTLIDGIKERPNSRRHILNAWNVALLPDESVSPRENATAGFMALPPCHVMYQFYVANGRLSCMLTQRSGDCFLGVPYNGASVALLTHMIAQQCDLIPGEIVHSFGDLHLYSNHIEQARLQIERVPKKLPELVIKRRPSSINDYKFEDFEVVGYDAHPHIPAPIAI
ncbi:thymidylate synthase [Pseudomonas syringae]|uniref:thymidylate synthase n=1 Tax=Pseudomonas syringae group TaxID=136849 RepID=UPI001424AF79|nr:thymidylate synthase [Pseudomonas coronafaciens]MBI6823912.1 thymidylate synthase [Pseudomonas syringae]QIQ72015.1 Thymidylate synthase [Pseudomonas coronafaciens]